MLPVVRSDSMNSNSIITDDWSNPKSKSAYYEHWPNEPTVYHKYQNGEQCGGCSFFAAFDTDWGLCCHAKFRHFRETVFEHFTCPAYVSECWGRTASPRIATAIVAARVNHLQKTLNADRIAGQHSIGRKGPSGTPSFFIQRGLRLYNPSGWSTLSASSRGGVGHASPLCGRNLILREYFFGW